MKMNPGTGESATNLRTFSPLLGSAFISEGQLFFNRFDPLSALVYSLHKKVLSISTSVYNLQKHQPAHNNGLYDLDLTWLEVRVTFISRADNERPMLMKDGQEEKNNRLRESQ